MTRLRAVTANPDPQRDSESDDLDVCRDHRATRRVPHFSNELIEDARIFLGRKLGRELNAEEARQMLVRLTNYFQTLIEWDTESRRQGEADRRQAA